MAARATGYIDVDVLGDSTAVNAMLNRLQVQLSAPSLMLFLAGVVQPWLRERTEERFKDEGDADMGKWAPLQADTQRVRSGLDLPIGPDHPINRRTGELQAFITGSQAKVVGATMGASMTWPGTVTTKRGIKTKLSTAQKGRANPKTIARPILNVTEADLAYTLTMLAFHVKGGRSR